MWNRLKKTHSTQKFQTKFKTKKSIYHVSRETLLYLLLKLVSRGTF